MSRRLLHDHNHDSIDRRGFLECMAWAGTGVLWAMYGGVLTSTALGQEGTQRNLADADFSFVQVSDSHIGFNKAPNQDVTATFQESLRRIGAMPRQPDFILHTGDLTHLAEAEEFDTVDQVLKTARKQVFYVPGEHDIIGDNGAQYLARYGKGTKGAGYYSFDKNGVHFIGLVNVFGKSELGLGVLGAEQLEWLKKDLAPLSNETPIVVFAHVPLWMVYPDWGWGTTDGAQALGLLRRFGSVAVLNGHIHQVTQKIEGHMTFHTACSTAFPQPVGGTAPKPGPMKDVPANKLRDMLGLTSVNYVENTHALALVDSTLA